MYARKLEKAVAANSRQLSQILLKEKSIPYDVLVRTLTVAVKKGYYDCVELLLLYGAPANIIDLSLIYESILDKKYSPLLIGPSILGIAVLLVSQGADEKEKFWAATKITEKYLNEIKKDKAKLIYFYDNQNKMPDYHDYDTAYNCLLRISALLELNYRYKKYWDMHSSVHTNVINLWKPFASSCDFFSKTKDGIGKAKEIIQLVAENEIKCRSSFVKKTKDHDDSYSLYEELLGKRESYQVDPASEFSRCWTYMVIRLLGLASFKRLFLRDMIKSSIEPFLIPIGFEDPAEIIIEYVF